MDLPIPPILANVKKQLEQYVQCAENLSIHHYEKNQKFWTRKPDASELIRCDVFPSPRTLKVHRNLDTGEIINFVEILNDSAGADATNSASLNRLPNPPNETVRGNALYNPFWPASFPEPKLDLTKQSLLENQTELLTVPPGFLRGLLIDEEGKTGTTNDDSLKKSDLSHSENIVDLLDLLNWDEDLLGVWNTNLNENTQSENVSQDAVNLPEEEEVLPKETMPIINLSVLPPPSTLKGSEWAILLDTSKPVKDFDKQIPDMAKKFNFELDVFQKLAILQLEKHNHVFVAAHTSAGKTVVAEYAIALSQKHMTRAIYTSPIKALSNQKYRDFREEFNDVGLITGDFQINQKASCLIMTTEILRSMLYCGSDITRDLEYVIFDEVHYINDRERGHVWEQVLIMLPPHVCVVLLSATVPNTIEFADWLGRTHQRKVYVVTTSKRPVPLQHFLYTGHGGSSRDHRYLILDADKWCSEGYTKALEALEQHKNHRQPKNVNSSQEKTLWTGLVSHLRKNDLLPVVAFIFSRQKCDRNAEILSNLDLTTQKEKSQITVFFNKCLRCLKEPDQKIPQIVKMQDILNRGIGIHHSGVLPIVKEIVEMLFQKGLIKILFATETFAMGVNMPARTVIFDSIQKHDGVELRNLLPAEYIQMAGRAGRRGKDEKGTVIILCKWRVPLDTDLRAMMTGLPSKLVSQFRLTYGMVLSLLRVESLSVEGMMSRSFAEADHQKNVADIQKELEKTELQLDELNKQQLSGYLEPLVKYYDAAAAYLNKRNNILPYILNTHKLHKAMQPGTVVVITKRSYINHLGLILSVDQMKKYCSYKVLVLGPALENEEDNRDDLWYQMIALARSTLYLPHKINHTVLTVSALDIFEISSKTLKLNTELVLKDWQKRQIERFRDDPAGQTCSQAVQDLEKLTMLYNENSSSDVLPFLHFITDFKINDQQFFHDLKEMYEYKDRLVDYMHSTQIPNFEQQFLTVFNKKFIEEKKKNLEFKLSNASLILYPDYQNRIELLRRLNYVDGNNRVQLKGRVACEMGMNELFITEMVVDNIFEQLTTSEVAALLSSLVFKVKLRFDGNEFEDDLTPGLKKGIERIKAIHLRIAQEELQLDIHTEEFQSDLNFGLVHIVHRWANAEPFVDIMKLTEIQEGIIVRCIQQLNETIMDVRDAARIIGDPELQSKMEEASTCIKRDIVFADSLYTHDDIKG